MIEKQIACKNQKNRSFGRKGKKLERFTNLHVIPELLFGFWNFGTSNILYKWGLWWTTCLAFPQSKI